MTAVKHVRLHDVAGYSDTRISSSVLSVKSYVGTENLIEGKLGVIESSYMPEKGQCIEYQKGDTLIGNIRPYLKKIWFAENTGGSSPDVLTIRPKENINAKFLFYALFRDDFFSHMMNGRKGTKMPRGDRNQVMDFLIPDFSPTEQDRVVSILEPIDKLIQKNLDFNTVLEAYLRTCYEYWFLQFDFPDSDGKPYKSSGGSLKWCPVLKRDIPESWSTIQLSDLLPVLTGKEDANFATSDGKFSFFTCSEDVYKCDSYAFSGKAVLLAGNGNFNIKLYNGKFNAYQRTYVLIPNDVKHYTNVYFSVKDRIQHLTNGSRGSIVKFITKGDIETIPIALPPRGYDHLFEVLNSVSDLLESNLRENQRLKELRDYLLPLLMNGQI